MFPPVEQYLAFEKKH
jgi:hypothetical protein